MAKHDKVPRSYRLERRTAAMLEQYARDEGITNTEAVERAIKHLCRVGNAPATQQDIAALTEVMRAGFAATQQSIEQQPIAAIEKAPKQPFWKRLIGGE